MSKGLLLSQVETPALVIDRDRVERNIRDMAEHCRKHGVRLRPHIKTHKTPELARMQLAAGAVGITVAKLGEAEVMAEHGIDDIFIANQIIGESKVKRLYALAEKIRQATVLVDSAEGVAELARGFQNGSPRLDVCIEINITDPRGEKGRCGVPYGDKERLVALAREIGQQPGLRFAGILGFRGVPAFFRKDRPPAGIDLFEQAGREEGEILVALANDLRREGIEVEQVIAGSTPTAKVAAAVPGITEVHPGEYVFSGGTHVQTGLHRLEDCAMSVIATVVSRPHPSRAIIDGGSKTFAGDLHPEVYPNLRLQGFGIVSTLNGSHDFPQRLPGAVLSGLNEEHGFIAISSEEAAALKVGDRLRIVPNHVCPVVNLFDRFHVVQGETVVDVWEIRARGKLA